MANSNLTIRLNNNDKDSFSVICERMGLSVNAAINVFIKAVIREEKIPFEVSAREDSFYSKKNMYAIEESLEQLRAGRVVEKSMSELEALANE